MSGSVETRTKRSHAGRELRDPLTLPGCTSSAATAHSWAATMCVSAQETHRAALQVQRAAVRGALNVRSAVHPPTALVCWQVRGPRTAPMAAVLRHHPGGARQVAPACSVGESGTAHTPHPRHASTTQPDIRLHYPSGRRPSDAALEPLFDGCQAAALGSSVAALRSSRRPPCACRCVRRCVDGAAHEVRTAAGRRAS